MSGSVLLLEFSASPDVGIATLDTRLSQALRRRLIESLPLPTLAELAGVHIDTARRWKRAGRIPSHHATIVQLRLHGELGTVDRQWQGWRLTAGQLWTPEDQPVRPGEIRSIPYSRQLIQELQRQLAEPQQRSLF